MNGKFRKSIIAAVLAIVAIAAVGPVHAQNASITGQYDRASYVPGDSGTLTVTIVNNGGNPLELRNITVYFPWAQLVNGKWPSPAPNVTNNLSPFVELGTQSSNNNIYTWSTSFTVPSWFSGGSIFGSSSNCPGYNGPRYSTDYRGCIMVGVSGNPSGYDVSRFSIAMALPTYTPTSIQTQWFAIAEIAVLGVVTVLLAMVWSGIRRLAKK